MPENNIEVNCHKILKACITYVTQSEFASLDTTLRKKSFVVSPPSLDKSTEPTND